MVKLVYKMSTPLAPLPSIIEADFTQPTSSRNRPIRRKFICPYDGCNAEFTQNIFLEFHYTTRHNCSECGVVFLDTSLHVCPQQGGSNVELDENANPSEIETGNFRLDRVVHNGGLFEFKQELKVKMSDYTSVYDKIKDDVYHMSRQMLSIFRGIKIQLQFNSTLERVSDGKILDRELFTPFNICSHKRFIKTTLASALNYLNLSLSLYEASGSGWRLINVPIVIVRIMPYKESIGRRINRIFDPLIPSGNGYIPSPPCLNRKKVLNIREKGNRCFMLSIVARLYREEITVDGPEGYSKTRRLLRKRQNPHSYTPILKRINGKEINFDGFRQTVHIDTIRFFEQLNEITVNVFMLDGVELYRAYISSFKFEKTVNLLLLEQVVNGVKEGHYTVIEDLSAFNGMSNFPQMDYCRGCIKPMKEGNTTHDHFCQTRGEVVCVPPKPMMFKFNRFKAHMDVQYKLVFTIVRYSSSQSVSHTGGKYTKPMANSNIAGYFLLILDPEWNVYFTRSYFEQNPIEDLMVNINEKSNDIITKVQATNVPLIVDQELMKLKQQAKICPLCHEEFSPKKLPAYNHEHHSGKL